MPSEGVGPGISPPPPSDSSAAVNSVLPDGTETITVLPAGGTGNVTVGVTPGTYVATAGGSTITVTGAEIGLLVQFAAGATGAGIELQDHLDNPIGAVGPTGGLKIFGDRVQAGPGVTGGNFLALDGTTSPPSLLSPASTYGAGNRIWFAQGTPAAQWVAGTTNVDDLWYNASTGQWQICTVSGAGTTAGTWAYCTIIHADGTVSAPGVAFSDGNSGLFRSTPLGVVTLNFDISGSNVMSLNGAGGLAPVADNSLPLGGAANRWSKVIGVLLQAGNGTAAAPTHTFNNDLATGLYLISAGNMGVAVSGALVGTWESTGLIMNSLRVQTALDGQAANDLATVYQTHPLMPSGWTAETCPRNTVISNTVAALSSGVLRMCAVYLPKGTVVSNLNFVTGATPATLPTHCWMGLFDNNRNLLANTADNGSAAIAASVLITQAITTVSTGSASSFTTTYSGIHYVGLSVSATTTNPTMAGQGGSGDVCTAIAPVLAGSSTTQAAPPSYPFQGSALSSTSLTYMGTS